jgi:serine/threonine protein kinase
MLDKGEVFDGKYRVEKVLRREPGGVLFTTRDHSLNPFVAIRVFRAATFQSEKFIPRFVRAAKVYTQIRSEHVLRLLEVSVSEAGDPYTVTEFLEGTDLANWIRRRGPLSVEQAVDTVLQACDGIAAAQAHGVVHRIIKPAHLFAVEPFGAYGLQRDLDVTAAYRQNADDALASLIKVIGWESRTAEDEDPFDLTSPSIMVSGMIGVPCVDGMEPANRSLIRSIGYMLAELVTGQARLDARSLTPAEVSAIWSSSKKSADVARTAMARFDLAHMMRSTTAFPEGLPLSREFETVVLRCVQEVGEKPFGSLREVAVALADFGSDRTKPLVERICAIPRRIS